MEEVTLTAAESHKLQRLARRRTTPACGGESARRFCSSPMSAQVDDAAIAQAVGCRVGKCGDGGGGPERADPPGHAPAPGSTIFSPQRFAAQSAALACAFRRGIRSAALPVGSVPAGLVRAVGPAPASSGASQARPCSTGSRPEPRRALATPPLATADWPALSGTSRADPDGLRAPPARWPGRAA